MTKQRKDRIERNKALKKWSGEVRGNAGGACEVCGKTRGTQAHHLLCKERYPEFRTHPMNGICLCAGCHKFGRLSAHRNGIWFTVWLATHKQQHYQWVIKNLFEGGHNGSN